MLDTNSWVNVLAITPSRNWFWSGSFATDQEFSLEPPRGVIEEDPIEAGLRELKEETGYVGENATLIGTAAKSAILSNQCYFVVVENVMKTRTSFDQHEELVTERILRISREW